MPSLSQGQTPIGMSGEYIGQSQNGCLPNITGSIGTAESHNAVSGAFYDGTTSGGLYHRANSDGKVVQTIDFNASRSNSIYGNGWFDGTKVIPAGTGVSYIIKY